MRDLDRACPMLTKAKTDELTTGEVMTALRELAALNGAGSLAGIEVRQIGGRQLARVVWGHGLVDAGNYYEAVEDALCFEREAIERCAAEAAE